MPTWDSWGPDYHLRAFASSMILTEEKQTTLKYDVVLSVLARYASLRYKRTDWSLRSPGFIVPESGPLQGPVPSSSYRGCRVQTKRINYPRLKEWLGRCERSHPNACSIRYSARSIPTKCIDCHTRGLVQINLHDRYFALSYVWGTPSSKDNDKRNDVQRPRKLPLSGVPQVVEDALIVVKSLGQRYHWVDKFCIDQHESDARHYRIQNMDLIYERAYAIIVSSDGRNAGFGLLGVRAPSRNRQPSAVVGNQLFVSTLPPISSALSGSVWTTRGWTYQEAILSRRCLFFTKLQVYFVCAAMTCCEAVVSGVDDTTLSSPSTSNILDANIFEDRTVGPQLRKFMQHVKLFNNRNFTYERDALDAFRGVLSRFHFGAITAFQLRLPSYRIHKQY